MKQELLEKMTKEELINYIKKLETQNQQNLKDLQWLSALEIAGVNNWEGYDNAVDIFDTEYGEDNE